MTHTPTTIRVFTDANVPGSDETVALVQRLAATHGLGLDLIDTTADAAAAITAGVMAVPAVVLLDGDREVYRRECALSGRRLDRWFERRLSNPAASRLVGAIA